MAPGNDQPLEAFDIVATLLVVYENRKTKRFSGALGEWRTESPAAAGQPFEPDPGHAGV